MNNSEAGLERSLFISQFSLLPKAVTALDLTCVGINLLPPKLNEEKVLK